MEEKQNNQGGWGFVGASKASPASRSIETKAGRRLSGFHRLDQGQSASRGGSHLSEATQTSTNEERGTGGSWVIAARPGAIPKPSSAILFTPTTPTTSTNATAYHGSYENDTIQTLVHAISEWHQPRPVNSRENAPIVGEEEEVIEGNYYPSAYQLPQQQHQQYIVEEVVSYDAMEVMEEEVLDEEEERAIIEEYEQVFGVTLHATEVEVEESEGTLYSADSSQVEAERDCSGDHERDGSGTQQESLSEPTEVGSNAGGVSSPSGNPSTMPAIRPLPSLNSAIKLPAPLRVDESNSGTHESQTIASKTAGFYRMFERPIFANNEQDTSTVEDPMPKKSPRQQEDAKGVTIDNFLDGIGLARHKAYFSATGMTLTTFLTLIREDLELLDLPSEDVDVLAVELEKFAKAEQRKKQEWLKRMREKSQRALSELQSSSDGTATPSTEKATAPKVHPVAAAPTPTPQRLAVPPQQTNNGPPPARSGAAGNLPTSREISYSVSPNGPDIGDQWLRIRQRKLSTPPRVARPNTRPALYIPNPLPHIPGVTTQPLPNKRNAPASSTTYGSKSIDFYQYFSEVPAQGTVPLPSSVPKKEQH